MTNDPLTQINGSSLTQQSASLMCKLHNHHPKVHLKEDVYSNPLWSFIHFLNQSLSCEKPGASQQPAR